MTDTIVELFIDGVWVDVTALEHVYTRDPISISRGRANEASQVEASRCNLTLKNTDGRYSPRNPLSPYYGKIGRNTPVRVRADIGEIALIGSSASGKAATPDTPSLDITGDIDLRAQVSLVDWQSEDIESLIVKDSGGAASCYVLQVLGDGRLRIRWSTNGSDFSALDSTETTDFYYGAIRWVRATLDVNNGAGGHTAAFYTSNDGATWTQLGQAVTASGTTSIFSGVGELKVMDGVFGRMLRAEVRNGIVGTVVANPDFTAQTAGASSFVDSTGKTWTVSSPAILSTWYSRTRFTGETSSFPVSWEPSGGDVWVPIEASGILRRLGQGSAPAASGVRTYIEGTTPNDYYPLDESAGDRPLGVSGTVNIVRGGGDLGDLPVGLRINNTETAGNSGYLYGYILQAGSPSELTLDFVYKSSGVLGDFVLDVWTEEVVVTDVWQLAFISDGEEINTLQLVLEEDVHASSGVGSSISSVSVDDLTALTDGNLHHVRFSLAQNGANLDYTIYIDGVSVLSGTRNIYTLKPAVYFDVEYAPVTSSYISVGHFASWFDNAPEVVATATAILNDLAGEAAGRRIERICEEAGIPFTSIGDLDDTALMGPQGQKKPLEILEECAEVDMGILYEPRDSLGLVYRTRKDLYNQDVGLTLDYTTGVFSKTPQPVDDDQLTRNDVTATRPDGGAYRVALEAGPLSIQDPPDGVGPYDTEVTVNVLSDALLPDQASWRLHLGTIDEARYPLLAVPMHAPTFVADAVLTADAAALDIGDRVRITNLPSWLPPDDVDQLAQGFTEVLGAKTWDVEVNCVPASPYEVAVYGSAEGSGPDRYDTAGSELGIAVDTTATSLSVEDTGGTLWTTNVAEFPFDIFVGGERMTVMNITSATSPQTFTVTRSVNGIVKSHAIGTAVRLWKTPRYGL